MLLSPYFFDVDAPENTFDAAVADFKAWYFWAQVLEMGTALAYTTVSTAEHGITYFIVDPSVDNHPCVTPEEFLQMLTGHEEQGKYWGYSWTILQMANNWHLLIQQRYPGVPYKLDDYALQINYLTSKVDIIPKSFIWESIGDIEF